MEILAGLFIAVLILVWVFYGLHVLDLHRSISEPLADWFAEPGNNVRAIVAGVSLLIAIIALSSKGDSYLGQFKGDLLSIAITVVILDELASYRSRLEKKQEIIDQIESPVRDAAVEAIRLARKNGFLNEALKKANLWGAHLEGADLVDANLEGVILIRAQLEGADLFRAYLKGAYLVDANLKGAYLSEAHLEGAKLLDAYLEGADLSHAYLEGADLRRADLEGVFLWGAHLEGADLSGAHLEGAILVGEYLGPNFGIGGYERAIYDLLTIWPNGFDPQVAGAILID